MATPIAFALIQLRKTNPQQAQLVTGVKRDINLLKHVAATPEHHISVPGISFDNNGIAGTGRCDSVLIITIAVH